MAIAKDLAISCCVFGLLAILVGVAANMWQFILFGVIGLVAAAVFGNWHWGTVENQKMERYLDYKASKGRCDWCSGDIGETYWNCRKCAEVFCSQRCYYEHRNNVHAGEAE